MCLETEFQPIWLRNDKDIECPTWRSHVHLDVTPTVQIPLANNWVRPSLSDIYRLRKNCYYSEVSTVLSEFAVLRYAHYISYFRYFRLKNHIFMPVHNSFNIDLLLVLCEMQLKCTRLAFIAEVKYVCKILLNHPSFFIAKSHFESLWKNKCM